MEGGAFILCQYNTMAIQYNTMQPTTEINSDQQKHRQTYRYANRKADRKTDKLTDRRRRRGVRMETRRQAAEDGQRQICCSQIFMCWKENSLNRKLVWSAFEMADGLLPSNEVIEDRFRLGTESIATGQKSNTIR